MNIKVTGLHLDVTQALRQYVQSKLDRINRHVDDLIEVSVILSVDKLVQKVEANAHLAGKDIHVEATDMDMYAAIDLLADKLDRQVIKFKEKHSNHHARGKQFDEASI